MVDWTHSRDRRPRAGLGTAGWGCLAWRAFWLVMLIGHAPALLSAVVGLPAGGSWLRFGLLLGASALFLLKVADVRWLRLPGDRRTIVAITTVIVLLHGGVLLRSARVEPADINVALLAPVVTGALALLAPLLALRAARGRALSSAVTCAAALDGRFAVARSRAAPLPPRFLCLERHSLLDRAPPRPR